MRFIHSKSETGKSWEYIMKINSLKALTAIQTCSGRQEAIILRKPDTPSPTLDYLVYFLLTWQDISIPILQMGRLSSQQKWQS